MWVCPRRKHFYIPVLPFLFLLTRFVAYLFLCVGLSSYKYHHPASLNSGQFSPHFLSSHLVCDLSTFAQPTDDQSSQRAVNHLSISRTYTFHFINDFILLLIERFRITPSSSKGRSSILARYRPPEHYFHRAVSLFEMAASYLLSPLHSYF